MTEPPTEGTKYEYYVQRKGWPHRESGTDQINVEDCPFCAKSNWHFYINKNNGLWSCHHCGQTGNFYKLLEHCGDKNDALSSTKDSAGMSTPPSGLPDIPKAQARLMANEEALDYLVAERGFTMDVIERQKLGLYQLEGAEWLMIPSFQNGNYVYAKFRSLPPAKKNYKGIAGRETPLYNGDVVAPGMADLLLVEGELDVIACLSAGINNVAGVPGANVKKATWIDRIDNANLERVYLLYDRDKVGQAAAREMAARIGIEKVYNIVLPEFSKDDGSPGKDINEWFKAGHSLADFEALKAKAVPFDVAGVSSLGTALDTLEQEIASRDDLTPKYDSPWPSLNKILGGAEPGDVIDIIAEGKVGKAQPLHSLVDLANGSQKLMGMLKVGDKLASIDGQPNEVLEVIDAGVQTVYQVHVYGGSVVECAGDHLWEVWTGNGTKSLVSTSHLRSMDRASVPVIIKSKASTSVYLFPVEKVVCTDRAVPMKCIVVSHPSHLYSTENGVLTHNSTMALNWADYVVQKYNENVLYFCLEMTPARLARKWVSHITQTDDSPGALTKEQMLQAISLAKDVALNREGDLLFGYNKVMEPKEVYDTIRQAVRRYGVKFAVFDNLQLLADSTLKSLHNRTIHLSQISKTFKTLATELGVVIVRIIQPNRVKDGEIVDAHNADGSSQIEKDCDAMIALHRNRKASLKQADLTNMPFVDVEEIFEPQMLVKVVLSRYAGGGMTTLRMDGQLSSVREWSDTEREVATAPTPLAAGELPVNSI